MKYPIGTVLFIHGLYWEFSSFLKNHIMYGIAVIVLKKSATNWDISTPVNPKHKDKIKIAGIK